MTLYLGLQLVLSKTIRIVDTKHHVKNGIAIQEPQIKPKLT